MKKIFAFCAPLWIVVAAVSSGAGSGNIVYKVLADYGCRGGYTAPILEVIRTNDQLKNYFSQTEFDTTRLSEKPDFAASTGIGLISKFGGGSTVYSRTIQKIIDKPDTVIVEVHCDTQNLSVKVQQGYQVVLLSIPKTEKPVFNERIRCDGSVQPFGEGDQTTFRTASVRERL